MSMGELGSLGVPVVLDTAGLDRGLAAAQGRLRDANGRFIAGMGGISAASGAATTGMTRHFRGVQVGLGGLQRTFASVGTAFGTFAGNITSRLAMMGTRVAGDVLGGAAIDLEKRIAGLAKAADLAGPELAAMKREIYGLSTELKGVEVDALIEIATTGAKMGIAGDELLKYAEGVAKVSMAIDDMPAGEIADQIGKVNSVFKLGVEGTMQLGSAFDRLADSGVSSASGILSVVQRISGTASASKITAQESAALAAALLDTGTHAELGATSLARLIAALNDTEAHASFAKAMGISAAEFAAKVRASPIKAIEEFLAALAKLDAGGQMTILKGMNFEGVQGAGEIQKLAAQSETLARYIGMANDEFRTLAQLEKSVAVNTALTGSAITQMQNRFRIMSDTIGTSLMPVTNAMVATFGRLATGIEGAFTGNNDAINNLRIGLAGVRDRLSAIPAALSAALGPEAIAILERFAADFVRYFNDMIAQAGVIVRNLPAMFDIAALEIAGQIAGIGAAFMQMGGAAAATWDYVRETGVAAFTYIGDFASNVFDRLLAGIRNLFNGIGTAMENILTANVGDIFKGQLDILKGYTPERGPDLLPAFKMPTLKLPELDRGATRVIEDQIADRWASIARAEGNRADAAMRALGGARPRGASMLLGGSGRMPMPGVGFGPNTLAAIGRLDPFAGSGAAQGRMALTPRKKAIRSRVARAARIAGRQAGGAARSRGGAVDILGGIDKTLNSLLNVNKSTDDQLKKGVVGRLG